MDRKPMLTLGKQNRMVRKICFFHAFSSHICKLQNFIFLDTSNSIELIVPIRQFFFLQCLEVMLNGKTFGN